MEIQGRTVVRIRIVSRGFSVYVVEDFFSGFLRIDVFGEGGGRGGFPSNRIKEG